MRIAKLALLSTTMVGGAKLDADEVDVKVWADSVGIGGSTAVA